MLFLILLLLFLFLGIIGLLEIPLDMMTITIAAITIGIAVDNSIHYIYRFKEEFKKINNYNKTLDRCHSTVGCSYFKYINNYSIWFFNFSFIKFYTYYLFWCIYRNSNVVSNDFSFNFIAKINSYFKPFGKEVNNLI